jgi:hypothetical protein
MLFKVKYPLDVAPSSKDPSDRPGATLFSDRSHCWHSMGDGKRALQDAHMQNAAPNMGNGLLSARGSSNASEGACKGKIYFRDFISSQLSYYLS